MAILDANIIDQLTEVFKKLDKNIKIVNFVSDDNEKSQELQAFLDELSVVSDKLTIEHTDSNDARYTEFGIDKLPALAFVDSNGKFTGGKFHGIPGGHEINSFVLTLLNTADAGQAFDSDILDRVAKIQDKVDLKVFVTLDCHHCPDVVANTQHLAIKNENISAQMIDVFLFPELADEAGIKSVPTVIYNDKVQTIGAKGIYELLDNIESSIE
jgi:thioredoxin reductase (NADPH)